MSLTKAERSAVWAEYNRLRGRGNVERSVLNRALGLVQSGEERPYRTDYQACSCAYNFKTKKICKHMAAKRMKEMARKARQKPRFKTSATCAHCGEPIYAQNRTAFVKIQEYWNGGGRQTMCQEHLHLLQIGKRHE